MWWRLRSRGVPSVGRLYDVVEEPPDDYCDDVVDAVVVGEFLQEPL